MILHFTGTRPQPSEKSLPPPGQARWGAAARFALIVVQNHGSTGTSPVGAGRFGNRIFGVAVAVVALVLISALDTQPTFAQVDPTSLDPYGDSEQIRKDFDEILAQPEFRRLRAEAPQPSSQFETPGWLKRFFDWLGDLLSSAGGAFFGLGVVLQALAWAVLAAIFCLIIWLVVKAVNRYRERQNTGLRGRRSYEEGEADIPPGDLPADEYLRRATELAQKGMFRDAIGQLILGAMSATERSGLVRFRRGLTHRDYLRALRGRTQPHNGLRAMVGVYEPICFGRRPAQVDHYRTSLECYETGFRLPITSEPAGELPSRQVARSGDRPQPSNTIR